MDVLEVCLHAEQIPPELDSVSITLETDACTCTWIGIYHVTFVWQYRDKLLWLQKLKYRPHSFHQLPPVYREVQYVFIA